MSPLAFALGASVAVAAIPAADQAALDTWWSAAARMWTTETAYRADGTTFEDGVCVADFREGILVPIYSGRPPVSERMVGAVFVGDGTLTVRMPLRADAWRVANHLVRRVGRDPVAVAPIAHQETDLVVPITRGMILSADPKVERLFYEMDPVGAGAILRPGESGIDEEYVITESRGKMKARVVAGNLLPNRRLQLQRAGLDPRAIIRQDRMLREELGLSGDLLRLVADFRTETPLHVVQKGTIVGPADHDQWVTCFRDGLDQTATGFRSLAFAHGTDHERVRHFMRLSGEPATLGADGGSLVYGMEAVSADARITVPPARGGNYRAPEVDSTLTLRARGGPVRWVGLRLPVPQEMPRAWELVELALPDGTPVPWVGLTADLTGAGVDVETAAPADVAGEAAAGEEVAASDSATAGEAGLGEAPTAETTEEPSLDGEVDQDSAGEGALVGTTRRRFEILALLPEAVPEGQTVALRLRWRALWQFAAYSNAGRYLGPTTGARPVLPELLPAPGGTVWDARLEVGSPPPGLRTVGVAVTGETQRAWTDGEGWNWVETRARGARSPAVAVGRWLNHDEPAEAGLPAVRVHLFPSDADGLGAFPPEVRAIVHWLQRFLPDFPSREVEVFQGSSRFAEDVLEDGAGGALPGLVAIERVTVGDVGGESVVDDENPHLMQSMVARQLAHQYWGQRVGPLSPRDAWAAAALSEAFAAFFERAVYGNEAYEKRMSAVRAAVEQDETRDGRPNDARRKRRDLSLSGATGMTDVPAWLRNYYGLYVIADMLRLRVGDQAYFAALDRLATERGGGTLSTRDLRTVFQEASGRDLSSFFDYWVDGGFVPALSLTWRGEEANGSSRVRGCIESDVAFGRFDVPVAVTGASGRPLSALVEVVDGRGSFEVTVEGSDPKVELDPMGMVVAYGRDVRRGEPACGG